METPPDGCRLFLQSAGDACAWRLTTPDGAVVSGFAPDRNIARRSAALAAFLAPALERTKARRF